MKYYLIAGEASGDLHGSNLMKGLFAEDMEADIRFWGGGMMEAVGGTKVRDYKATAVMGLTDVLASLGLPDQENVLIAGDAASGPSLVVRAIADGLKCAKQLI